MNADQQTCGTHEAIAPGEFTNAKPQPPSAGAECEVSSVQIKEQVRIVEALTAALGQEILGCRRPESNPLGSKDQGCYTINPYTKPLNPRKPRIEMANKLLGSSGREVFSYSKLSDQGNLLMEIVQGAIRLCWICHFC